MTELFDPSRMEEGEARWIIPNNNLSRGFRWFLAIRALVALLIVLTAWALAPHPFFRYFVGVVLVLIGVGALVSSWNRVAYTELDFSLGVLRRHFWLRGLRRPAVRRLGEFETVLSSCNVGPGGANSISVSLSGRHGALELARFEPDDAGGRDQATAWCLRDRLAKRLALRDIGVV